MGMTIDQKIVEMRFDNKNFEENVQESISTIGRLKESLDFDNVNTNFNEISKAASNVDLSSITAATQKVSTAFSAMEVAAITACKKIVEDGLNALENGIKALTLDQVTEGWQKFTDKTESVGTIMAATGLEIEEVNKYLEQLNWFSDETSYNFTDMTSNVGKFTSAGIKLEDAVTAMEGIATWASLSGQNANVASRAMYNLSQAMGMGYLGLGDWRSIELANMATMEFKELTLETAAALGVLKEYSDGTFQYINDQEEAINITAENFRSTLSEKWLNQEVMMAVFEEYGKFANELSIACDTLGMQATDFMQALEDYDGSVESIGDFLEETGLKAEDVIPIFEKLGSSEYELARKAFESAQASKTLKDSIDATADAVSTQWMKTFEYLFGNYDQAKEFFTAVTDGLYDLFGVSGEVRNDILKQWSGAGFGDVFRAGLIDLIDSIVNVVDFFRNSFKMIFPESTIETAAAKLGEMTAKFKEVTEKISEFTEGLTLSQNAADNLRAVFDGVGAVFKIIWNLITSLTPLWSLLSNIVMSFVSHLLGGVAALGKIAVKINDVIQKYDIFGKIVGTVTDLLKPFVDIILDLYDILRTEIKSFAIDLFNKAVEKGNELLPGIIDKCEKFREILDKVKEKASALRDFLFGKDIPTENNLFNFGSTEMEHIPGLIEKIADKFSDLKEKIQPVKEFFLGKDIPSADNLFTFGSAEMEHVPGLLDKVAEGFSTISEKIRSIDLSTFTQALNRIGEKLQPVKDFFFGKDIPSENNLFDFGSTEMEHVSGLFEIIAEGFSNFKEKIQSFDLSSFKNTLGEIGGKLQIVRDFLFGKDIPTENNLFTFGSSEMEHVPGLLERIGNGFSTIKEKIESIDLSPFTDMLDRIGEKLQPVKDFFFGKDIPTADNLFNFGSAEMEHVPGLLDRISEGFSKFKETIKNIDFASFTQTLGKIGEKLQPVKEFFLGKDIPSADNLFTFGSAEMEHVPGLIDRISDAISNFKQTLSGIGEKLQPVKDFFFGKDIPTADNLFTFGSSEMEHIPGLLEKISDGFSTLKEKILGANISLFGKDFGSLADVFDKVRQKISDAKDRIKEFFSVSKENIDTSNLISFHDILEKIKTIISPVKNKVVEIFDKLKTKLDISGFKSFHDVLEKIKEVLTPIWETLQNIFDRVKGFFKDIDYKNIFGDIWDFVSDISGQLWDKLLNVDYAALAGRISTLFRNIGKGLGDAIKNIDTENLLDNLEQMVLLFGGLNLGRLVGSISDRLSGKEGGLLESIISPASEMFDSVKKSISDFTQGTDSGKLLKIAFAIGILAAALVVLAGIDATNIDKTLGLIGGAIGAMAIGSKVMSTIGNSGASNLLKASFGMLIMAGAIKLMISALVPIADMNPEQLGKMGGALTAILTEMLIFIKLFSKYNSEHDAGNGMKAAFAMVEIGIAMNLMVHALKSISELNGVDYTQALIALTAMFGAMAGLSVVMKKWGTGDGMISLGAGMVIIALAMNLMVPALKSISQLNGTDYAQAIFALIAILGAFSGLSVAMKFTKNAGEMVKAGASLVIMALAVDMLVPALKSISKLNGTDYAQAIGALIAIFGAFGALSVAMAKWSNPATMLSMAAAMVAMSVAMNLFALAGMAMTLVSWESLGKIGVVLAGILGAGAIAGISVVTKGLLAISAVLISMGASVALVGAGVMMIGAGLILIATGLAMLNLAGILASLTQIGTALAGLVSSLTFEAAIAGLLQIAKLIPQVFFEILAGILEGFATITDSFDVFLESAKKLCKDILNAVEELFPELVDTALKLLLGVLSSLAENAGELIATTADLLIKIFDGLIEYVPPLVAGLVNLLCAVFDSLSEHIPTLLTSFMNFAGQLFGEILKALNASQPDAVLKMIEFVGFLDVLIVSCAALKTVIPGALAGLFELGIFVAELSAILAALGELYNVPHFADMVSSGGNLLELIGQAIGKFVGGFVGGTVEGYTDSLPQIGTNLSDFWTNLSPFIEGIKGVDQDTVTSITLLAGALLALVASDLINGITSFFSGQSSFQKFGTELAAFGPKFRVFANSVSGINAESVKAASESIKTIAETFNAEVFKSGGFAQAFKGETDLTSFGEGLAKFGPNLTSFANSVKGFDDSGIEKACNAVSKIATSFNKQAFRSGGVFGFFSGDINLLTFAEGLVGFGPKLKSFADSVKGFDDSGIETSTAAITSIATAFNAEVFKSGGLKQWIEGETDFSSIADGLAKMGPGLYTYSIYAKTIDDNLVSKTSTICKALSELLNSFPAASLFEVIFGTNGTIKFVNDLTTLATGLETFESKIDSVKMDQDFIGHVTEICTGLSTLLEGFPKKDAWEVIFGNDGTSNFIEDLGKLADGLLEVQGKFKEVDTSTLGDVSAAIKNLFDAVSGSGEFYVGETDYFGSMMFDTATKGVESFLMAFSEDKYSEAAAKGEAIFTAVVTGLTEASGEGGFKTAVETPVAEGLTAITEKQTNYQSAAASLMTQMKVGIGDNAPLFTAAIETALKEGSDKIVNSFMTFFDNGVALIDHLTTGVGTKKSEAVNKVKEIVSEMLKALNNKKGDFNTAGISLMTSFGSGIESAGLSVASSMYNIGAMIAQGLADGMNDNVGAVETAAKAIADAASNAAAGALGVESPSKVFYQIGAYVGEGFVNGMDEWIGRAETKSEEMGKSVISAVSEALAENIQNDIDKDPVIRPVLDLSDVEKGSKRLNTIFSANTAMKAGIPGNFTHAGTTTNSINNSKNFGGFTFNIYPEGGNAEEIARHIGVEVNRRIRQFSTI